MKAKLSDLGLDGWIPSGSGLGRGIGKSVCSWHVCSMGVEQIKRELSVLKEGELSEVTAFLFHLRHRNDPEYQREVAARSDDKEKSHWLTPEEFERELDKR
jgi:hypothetical protein